MIPRMATATMTSAKVKATRPKQNGWNRETSTWPDSSFNRIFPFSKLSAEIRGPLYTHKGPGLYEGRCSASALPHKGSRREAQCVTAKLLWKPVVPGNNVSPLD